ncbi:hypothetical protein [Streptomyces sp. 147326]|uniref:hypothetical protein n=1 Tax=Streptomyces sp. 147326 TaxID=3074379 RepID=UPI003857E9A9
MADTTVQVDSAIRERFAAVAAAHGKRVRACPAEPSTVEAFDRGFGGVPSSASVHGAA